MGGFYQIGIQSIRIVSTAQNFESASMALCLLDGLLSEGSVNSIMNNIKQNETICVIV